MDAVGEVYPLPNKQCCVFTAGMYLQGFNGVQVLYSGRKEGDRLQHNQPVVPPLTVMRYRNSLFRAPTQQVHQSSAEL